MWKTFTKTVTVARILHLKHVSGKAQPRCNAYSFSLCRLTVEFLNIQLFTELLKS